MLLGTAWGWDSRFEKHIFCEYYHRIFYILFYVSDSTKLLTNLKVGDWFW